MSKQLVMLGAGGHAKVCYEIAKLMNEWDEIVVLDDNLQNDFFEISGAIDTYSEYSTSDFFVAIGNNKIREKLYLELSSEFKKIVNLIHPNSIISNYVKIGEGTVIMPGAIINTSVSIGNSCIINTGSSVDHDCVLGDYVHLSPGVRLAGNVKLNDGTWMGISSSAINNVTIKENSVIGAGSVVVKDIDISGTYVGIPSRRLGIE